MYKSVIIPYSIIESSKAYIANHILIRGQKILENGRISISFFKDREDRFIISGIVTDSSSYQVKVQSKKNSDDQQVLVSNCNCQQWTQNDHCPHTAALYLHYELSRINDQGKSNEDSLKAFVSFHGQSVHVENYGRVELGASRLLGAQMNSTYSSMQYLLTTRKKVHFPLPQKLHGTIEINFISTNNLPEVELNPHLLNKFIPIFSYTDSESKHHQQVSMFEGLYLFNWESGDVYNIPSELSHIIKRFIIEGVAGDINQHIQLITPLLDQEAFNIKIKGQSLREIESLSTSMRFSILPAKRKGFLDLNLELFDNNEKIITPPVIFKTITGENGFLNSFRTKNDCYEFIKILLDSLSYNNQEYKKRTYSSSDRTKLIEWISFIQEQDEVLFFDEINTQVYSLKTSLFKDLLLAIFECFTETAARFSFYQKENRKIYYQLPKSFLFNGIASFYKRLQKHQIPIFYNNVEIKTWSSNIRFERQKSNLDWFEVNLVLDENDYNIIKNADLGEEYLVSDNGLVLLDSKEKELLKFMKKYTKHESQKIELDENNMQKFSLNFKRSRIFELFELKKHGIEGALTPEEEQVCENLLNMTEMPTYDLPEIFKDIPRDYQVTGYQWLRFLFENRFGACLADDMGLGKTLQTIMFLESIIDQVQTVLVVCPVSILLNWQNEIEKFSNLDIEIYYGEGRKLTKQKKIILTSYGVMKKEAQTTFTELNLDILIMDEVQHLKNIRSQGATAARNLQARFRICLTGTPVENDLSEFYNIMDLSIPGIWGDLSLFKSSSSKKSRLLARQTVRPFILRRTKEQVLTELPEKVENHVYLNFSQEEKEHYLTTLANIRKKMHVVQQGRKYSEILKSLLQLRQLCLWQNTKFLQSTKIDFLMENLEQLLEEGHKVLVFSQFTTYLDHIQNKIRERSWVFARIDGSQTMKKRQAEVERFQNGDAQVFLISLKAGGVGLNLTAASYIFLMDPWWNPAVENQAIDRAYRIGQENKLTVYRPIIKDSVEEKVLVLQKAKQELFKDLMSTDDESFFSGKLSLMDFQQLIT
ncbi:MAG: DEAD/DEAH box helicase [Halobacteriovoraceae bacterium]|jgi:SNF2 family DNA or RNA helicase|nr:DEAD/DEAH box helicase [Halobacteriovoraceae bacterium]